MPMNLQVVLQSDVEKLGKSGELLKVRPGYARNYLVPRGLAVFATESAVARVKHEKAVAIAKHEKAVKEAKATAEKLGTAVIKVVRTAAEDGKLFGTVTTKEIEAAAKAQGIEIDRRKMHLAEPIKAVGTYEIPLKIMSEVSATLKVEVTAKK
ncbi:MAG: 50S ribosomal protein L9 [Polyangiaceae bacterium]